MLCFWNAAVAVGEPDHGHFGCVGFSYRTSNGNPYAKTTYTIHVSKVCTTHMQAYKITKWSISFSKR